MSRQSIQVAEQGTLEAVLSAVQDLQARANPAHLSWLMDYKLFGEESYVFNNKDVLHELYRDYELVMNDNMINTEALDWIISAAESGAASVGKALASIHGIGATSTLKTLTTMGEVAGNETAVIAIINNVVAFNTVWLVNGALVQSWCNNYADNISNILTNNQFYFNAVGRYITGTAYPDYNNMYLSINKYFNSDYSNGSESAISDTNCIIRITGYKSPSYFNIDSYKETYNDASITNLSKQTYYVNKVGVSYTSANIVIYGGFWTDMGIVEYTIFTPKISN